MYEEEVKEICRKLKPIIGHRADRLWVAYATSESNIDRLQIQAAIQAVAALRQGQCALRFPGS